MSVHSVRNNGQTGFNRHLFIIDHSQVLFTVDRISGYYKFTMLSEAERMLTMQTIKKLKGEVISARNAGADVITGLVLSDKFLIDKAPSGTTGETHRTLQIATYIPKNSPMFGELS